MPVEWLASTQLSNDSEDSPIAYIELIKKIKADKAKKRKQQEAQLLNTTRKTLNATVTDAASKLTDIVSQTETSFESLLAEYVDIENGIRALLEELLDEQEHFTALCDAKEAAFILVQEQREERHDAAARSMKSACKGTR